MTTPAPIAPVAGRRIDACVMAQADEADYEAFVLSSPEATIYHGLAWRKVISDTYRFEPLYIIARNEDGICGVLPLFAVTTPIRGKRLAGLPFSHYVPILATDDLARSALLDCVIAQAEARCCRRIEMRDGASGRCDQRFHNSALNFRAYIDTARPVEELWTSLSGMARRAVRKAEKSDLRAERVDQLADYIAFDSLLATTHKRLGVPAYPRQLMQSIHVCYAASGQAHLHMAYLGKQLIAGVLILRSNGNAIYAYNASTSDRSLLSLRPNNLLIWQAIQDCAQAGDRIFDLGSTPVFHESLLAFKKQWGSTVEPLEYGFFNQGKRGGINREGLPMRIAQHMIRWMPQWMLRRISPFLLRESV